MVLSGVDDDGGGVKERRGSILWRIAGCGRGRVAVIAVRCELECLEALLRSLTYLRYVLRPTLKGGILNVNDWSCCEMVVASKSSEDRAEGERHIISYDLDGSGVVLLKWKERTSLLLV